MWDCLIEKDGNSDLFTFKKVDQPGVSICSWDEEIIKYGFSTKKILRPHFVQT